MRYLPKLPKISTSTSRHNSSLRERLKFPIVIGLPIRRTTAVVLLLSSTLTAIFLGPLAIVMLAKADETNIFSLSSGSSLASQEALVVLVLALCWASLLPALQARLETRAVERLIQRQITAEEVSWVPKPSRRFLASYRLFLDIHLSFWLSVVQLFFSTFVVAIVGSLPSKLAVFAVYLALFVVLPRRLRKVLNDESMKQELRNQEVPDTRTLTLEARTLLEGIRFRKTLRYWEMFLFVAPAVIALTLGVVNGFLINTESILVNAALVLMTVQAGLSITSLSTRYLHQRLRLCSLLVSAQSELSSTSETEDP